MENVGLSSFKFCAGLQTMHLFCSRVRIGHSRLSKVVDFGTSQKGVCDLLLVINSNLVLSCTVSEIRQLIGWKLWIFLTPPRGEVEPFRISAWTFYCKARVLGLCIAEDFVILACKFLTQCQRVTGRQTSRLSLHSKLCWRPVKMTCKLQNSLQFEDSFHLSASLDLDVNVWLLKPLIVLYCVINVLTKG